MEVENLYLEHRHYALAERGMTVKSFREIWRTLRAFTTYHSGTSMKEITTQTIRSFLIHGRMELGWCPKTFHTYRQYLSSFFEWAKRRGYIKSNPVQEIEKPRLPKRLPRFLTREEVRKILFQVQWFPWRSSFEKIRNPAILATFLMTGIRLQELLSLQTDDLNLKSRELRIRHGKGDKERLVPIHHQLQQILTEYVTKRKAFGKQAGFLFPSIYSNKRLYPKDIRSICRKIGSETQLKFTPHMFRHTFAREMIENDYPIFKLKEILGHTNISTTQIYTSISNESLKRSIEIVKMY